MKNKVSVLNFEGSQTIEKAEEVKDLLLSAFNEKNNEIQLDLSNVEKNDLSFLQLLYSAWLEAEKKNKKISFIGKIPQNVMNTIELTGFNKETGVNPFFLSAISNIKKE